MHLHILIRMCKSVLSYKETFSYIQEMNNGKDWNLEQQTNSLTLREWNQILNLANYLN